MKQIFNKVFLQHDTGNHPESKKRLEPFLEIEETPLAEMPIAEIEKTIELGHTKAHIEKIRQASKYEEYLDSDTPTSKKSFETACYAVAATLLAAENSLKGQNSFALVRPPGHHATRHRAMGFCLFNNIAITAKKLAKQGHRVLIYDFDCHYGNGTADICYDDPKIMYISTHQYPCYPGNGWLNETGEGKGKGYNICIPLPPHTGDDTFIKVLEGPIKAITTQFKPDIIGVSAGFDAYKDDPITNMNLSANSFYKAGEIFSGKKVFAVLEGGYNIGQLKTNVQAFIDGINKNKPGFNEQQTTTQLQARTEAEKRLRLLKEEIKEWWEI